MENKLDILTQKLYNEGVDKARQEAENIINQAKQEAEKIIADAKAKVAQMNTAQQAAIQAGVDIELTDGATEHFSLTDHDQTSLIGLQGRVDAGEEQIPWHTSDESEHCKFYTNADMAMITSAAMEYVTWHITYFRDLRIYIRSLQTKGEVEAVTYGMDIPQEYQSEPLRAMIAAKHL